MVSFMPRRRFFTSSCMRALASGGKYFSTYLRPERLAEQRIGRLRAALPARLHLARAVQELLAERELGLDEIGGQRRRGGIEHARAQVRLPVGDRSRTQLALELLHELRLGDVQLALRQPGRGVVAIPVEPGRELLQLRERHLVIGLLRIAQRDVVERRLRVLLLHAHHGLGCRFGLRLVAAGEREQALHVRAILLARFLEARIVLQVVVAIGHPERVRVVLRDHERRVVDVRIAEHEERRGDALSRAARRWSSADPRSCGPHRSARAAARSASRPDCPPASRSCSPRRSRRSAARCCRVAPWWQRPARGSRATDPCSLRRRPSAGSSAASMPESDSRRASGRWSRRRSPCTDRSCDRCRRPARPAAH